MRRPSAFYLAIYILANLCTFGAFWFVRSLISHSIYEANREDRDDRKKVRS